jgi:phenylpyruvate tautomerase PptA (4-oxalocrotonate tautomerase family)
MPIIHVTVPAGVLDAEAQAAVAAQLTDILMEIEGTKGNPTFAAGTWLQLTEAQPNTTAVGGKFASGRYHMVIDTPSGALNMEQKETLILRTTDALLRIEGTEPDPTQRARVYCLINEIPDGGWGFAGQAVTRAKIEQYRKSLAQSHA